MYTPENPLNRINQIENTFRSFKIVKYIQYKHDILIFLYITQNHFHMITKK